MAATLQQFIDNVVKSGLMSADEVSSFQQKLPPDKGPDDVHSLAKELVFAGKLTKYQAQMVYQGKPKGLVFGEYTVLDKLGQGGMGVVLKAQHRRMKRMVAVKVLPTSAMKSPEAVKRFYREAEAAARLNHPNIVTAFDASEHDGTHYLVMEFVDGQDLGKVLSEHGRMPVRLAVEYVLQAARGLAYAHAEGVIHRDIKPANLLVDKNGTVKILDMGLARMTGAAAAFSGPSDHLTRSGEVMGTCDYMAPEQAENTHSADHRADIYSLGCTFYRLLTAEPLYTGESLIQVLLAHREAPIPSLCAKQPDVPAALETIFQRMVAKRPEERYGSMQEVILDLEGYLSGAGPAPPLPSPAWELSGDAALAQNLSFLEQPTPGPGTLRTQRHVAVRESEPLRGHVPEDTGRKLAAQVKSAVASARKKPLVMYSAVAGGTALLAVLAALLFHAFSPPEEGGGATPLPRFGRGAGGEGSSVLLSPSKPSPKTDGPPPPLAVAPFDAATARKHQEAWATHLGVQVEFTNSIGMKFVLIPPGEFEMGINSAELERLLQGDRTSQLDEWALEGVRSAHPAHKVRISRPLWVGKHEVTLGQFRRFVAATGYETDVGQDPSHRLTWDAASWQFRADPEYSWSNPGYPQEDDHPAMRVSWNSACAFCDWLSTKEDKVYRLPTEAEWEYSCRAGTGTRFFPGDDESTLQGYGNVFDMSHEARVPGSVAVRKWTPLPWNDGFPFTAPVGRLKPNAYGLYDMHGNVGEWCADWFSSSYYGVSSLADPPGPLAGVERMVRDACFLNRGEPYMLSAFRARNFPDTTGEHVGFRVVLTIASSAAKSDEPGDFAGVPEFPDTPTVSTPPSALPDAKSAEVKAHFETGTSIDVTPRTGGPARASAEMPAAQSKAPAETADESKKATPTQANSSRAAEEANKTSAREKAESRYAQATAPIERLLAAWKFKEAAQELQQIKAEEADVAARLASQRDEVKRLIEIKSRIAQKINTTEPRLKKTALALRGMSGEATKADEEGITVTLASGKTELHAWDELGQKSVQSLIELVAEANSAEDWLAVGLLALRSQDLSLAERSLEKARSLGASIEPYLETLAPRAFAKAREFSAEKEYEKAAAALESIEQKYGKTAWFAANRKQFDAAEAEVREGEAEQIYAEAASLIASGDVFDARPLVERLKAEFATARAVTDAQRKPSFAEMDKATASLGRRIIVRSSGKADFRRIQDAVEAAVPNSCIEIQDNGPYNERIHIPPNKPRLVLRGGRGCWPIITDGPGAQPTSLLTFESEDATLERLVLIESGVRESCLLQHSGPAVEFRRCILYDVEGRGLFRTTSGGKIAVANSLILSPIPANSIELTMTNCILTARARLVLFNPSDLRQCTAADVELSDPITPQVILDSIIDRFVETKPAPHRLENCAFGMKPGAETKNCIFDNPRFRDPANLDFRLTGRSPCIGKASDGGDIGCRYTPEIAEICRVALELRRRGFLKF